MSLVWRSKPSTIPAALERFLQFQVAKDALAGKGRSIRVFSISYNNDSRPTADPRRAFAWKGYATDNTGDGSSSMLLDVNHVSSFNDAVRYFPLGLTLRPEEKIGFKLFGDLGDSVNAKVMYEVLE